MKEGEAKVLLSCRDNLILDSRNKKLLGKRTYEWGVPADLQRLAHKYKRAFIGLMRWRNTQEQTICIAYKNGIIYFDVEALKRLLKEFKDENQTEIPKTKDFNITYV